MLLFKVLVITKTNKHRLNIQHIFVLLQSIIYIQEGNRPTSRFVSLPAL